MKKFAAVILAAGTALAALPAAATTGPVGQTGVVNITGTVGEKCIVTNAGSAGSGAAFGGTVNLGALDDSATGKLKASGDLATAFAAAGTSNLSYRIVCTTAKTQVSVDSDPLINSGATATTGYANKVDYKATVALALVGGNQTVANDSTAAATSQTFNERMATGATNVSVTADTFRTANANDVLLAGTYNGKITISVAPAN